MVVQVVAVAARAGAQGARVAATTAGRGAAVAGRTAGRVATRVGRTATLSAGKAAGRAGAGARSGAGAAGRTAVRTGRRAPARVPHPGRAAPRRGLRVGQGSSRPWERSHRGPTQDAPAKQKQQRKPRRRDHGQDDDRKGNRSGGRGGVVGRSRQVYHRANTEVRESFTGGNQTTMPLGLAPRKGAERLAHGALGTARFGVRTPFKLARRIGRILKPTVKPKKLLRRLVIVGVLVMLLLVVAASALMPRQNELGGIPLPLLNAAMGAGVAPGGPGFVPGGYGEVGDEIPYADIFNGTASLGIDPRLVAAVAWAESGFAPDIINCQRSSRAGAQGIMQFMPDTARGRGIDPCDPKEAIPAGAKYLLEQYERFKSWDLALAAYNWGPGAVANHQEYPSANPMPAETRAYVPKVKAKWEEYKQKYPDKLSAGPVTPRGGTERYVDSHNTPTMQSVLDAIVARFGRGHGIGCFRDGYDAQDHGKGKACDFMVSTGGNPPTEEMRAHGQAMADWLVANAADLGVQYVIWEQRIWNISLASQGWRPMSDRGGITANHYDHVHVSVQ